MRYIKQENITRFFLLLIGLIANPTFASEDEKSKRNAVLAISSVPSISATLKVLEEKSADPSESYIRLSPIGMYVNQADDEYEVIKNFELKKAWLTNTSLRQVHEVNIPFYEEYFPSQVKYFTSPGSVSNVLGLYVCADFEGVFKGQRVWRNQVVQEWDCLNDENYLVDTQLYSDRWNMVVRSNTIKHGSVELVDIAELSMHDLSFMPDPKYEQVAFQEFVAGRLALEAYLP